LGRAARELVATLEALFAVGGGATQKSAVESGTPSTPTSKVASSEQAGPATERASAPRVVIAPSATFPKILAASGGGKLAVIGALSGRDRESCFPDGLAARTDFIDTARDGVHAIGNLPQRIRQGRVVAVIILDKAVQHQHTDPVVSAARNASIPIAFAGKGGQSSLQRALEQIEKAL
jgi:hypothetical protein